MDAAGTLDALDLLKATMPPATGGWQPIPRGMHGGYRRKGGSGRWQYWYPNGMAAYAAQQHHQEQAQHFEVQAGATKNPERQKKLADQARIHRSIADGAQEAGKSLYERVSDTLQAAPSAKDFATNPKTRKRVMSSAAEWLKAAPKRAVDAALHGLQETAEDYKRAGNAVVKIASRKSLDTHDRKALLGVGLSLAAASLGAGGVDVAAAHLVQNTALHTALKSVNRALGKMWMLNEGGHVAHHAVSGLLAVMKAEPPKNGKAPPADRPEIPGIAGDPDKSLRVFAALVAAEMVKILEQGITPEDEAAEKMQPEVPGKDEMQGAEAAPPEKTEMGKPEIKKAAVDPLALLKGEVHVESPEQQEEPHKAARKPDSEPQPLGRYGGAPVQPGEEITPASATPTRKSESTVCRIGSVTYREAGVPDTDFMDARPGLPGGPCLQKSMSSGMQERRDHPQGPVGIQPGLQVMAKARAPFGYAG